MKIDYYVGRTLVTKEDRVVLNGIFTKWHEVIVGHVDTKIISFIGKNNLYGKIMRKSLDRPIFRILRERRRNSILHIISLLLVNKEVKIASRNPFVISFFDAIPFENNALELVGRKFSSRTLRIYRKALEKSDRIITLSKHARHRISELCAIDEEKIDIAPLAIDHNVFKALPDNNSADLQEYGFSPEKANILYVGSESPRKNLKRLIKALSIVRKHKKIKFIKVGKPLEPFYSKLRSLIRKLDLEEIVHFQEVIEHDKLPMLYNCADLFVFPSLYEGFGLPPLEALACGCPVVTSDLTSIPEVVDDAAIKVNAYSYKDIAEGIMMVLESASLREELIEKGKKQALKFSWEKTVEQILKVYNTLNM